MNYYLDESGNTGDLINKKNDMGFAKQPIFTHSCIGIPDKDLNRLQSFVFDLKKIHGINESQELKSQDYYIKNPQLVFELLSYIVENKFPIVCEVMDKKYNIAVSIVNHLIIPPMNDESDGEAQYIRTHLTDFISINAPNMCFSTFSELCKNPNEENLIACMNCIKEFFIEHKNLIDDNGYTILMIDETLNDYYIHKNKFSEEVAIKWYVPIPDIDSNGNIVKLLPNVHSFYNQLARLNKIHNKNLSSLNLIHDTSSEFAETLKFCIKNIRAIDSDLMPHIPTCDYKVIEDPILKFVDSKNSIGVQIADIIAGFLNRYIYGLLYKEIEMNSIYHKTFDIIMAYNRTNDPIGTNFVIPFSKRHWLFEKFDL